MRLSQLSFLFLMASSLAACSSGGSGNSGSGPSKRPVMVDADGVCTSDYINITKDFSGRMKVISSDNSLQPNDRIEKLHAKCDAYLEQAGGVKCTTLSVEGAPVSDTGARIEDLCKSIQQSWMELHPTPEMIADRQKKAERKAYLSKISLRLAEGKLCEIDTYASTLRYCKKSVENLDQFELLMDVLKLNDLDFTITNNLRPATESAKGLVPDFLTEFWKKHSDRTVQIECNGDYCNKALLNLYLAMKNTVEQARNFAVDKISLGYTETRAASAANNSLHLMINEQAEVSQIQKLILELPKVDSPELKDTEARKKKLAPRLVAYTKRTRIPVSCNPDISVADCETGFETLAKSGVVLADVGAYNIYDGKTTTLEISIAPRNTKSKRDYSLILIDFSLSAKEMKQLLESHNWSNKY